jgi:uncharacterized protein YceK
VAWPVSRLVAAQTLADQMNMTTPPRRKRHPVLLVVATLVALGGCGTTASTTAPSTTTASRTGVVMTTAPVTTTASGPAPHSQLLPELVLPDGSTSFASSDGTSEVWTVPASWGAQSKILDNIRSQLPLSKPYDGLPWCNETVENKTGGLQWSWDDGQNIIIVTVLDQKVHIDRDADDPTWGGCASAAHSALANVDMPTGSQLDPNMNKPGLEVWTVLITDAETVAWLRQRLPVYGDYQGLKWCQDAGIGEGYTEWQWGTSRDWFVAHIYGQTVTFKRGPDMYGCVKN